MELPSPQDFFADFEKRVISKDAPLVQRAEMRMAFMAGMTQMAMLYDITEPAIFEVIIADVDNTVASYTAGVPTVEVYENACKQQ